MQPMFETLSIWTLSPSSAVLFLARQLDSSTARQLDKTRRCWRWAGCVFVSLVVWYFVMMVLDGWCCW